MMRPVYVLAVLLGGIGLTVDSQPVEARSFEACVGGLWNDARSAGVSRSTFNAATGGIGPDQAVLKAASRQPEFVKPIWDYLDGAVSSARISKGRELSRQYGGILDAIEGTYGVDRNVVLAIWGMESSFGAVLNNKNIVRPVIRSLATLACLDERRAKFGKTQLVAALQILERGDTSPARMTGSWAGAMGHTQFIPTTYNSYAVDFDGDGRRDIWTNVADALASTAHYLRKSGYEPGKTWGYEVQLPQGFNYALADRKTFRTLREWQRLGVNRVAGREFPRPRDKAKLVLPAGARGPAFLMLPNFDAILKYNNSTSYALGVGHLADRIRGGSGFVQSWPRGDTPLTRSQRRELQTILTRRGFNTGGIDGKIGPMTQSAIRDYQARSGLVADGYASLQLLQRLRQ
ncbi:MAG: lytic murein transglycosylase [Pseudomonadota bacterium]